MEGMYKDIVNNSIVFGKDVLFGPKNGGKICRTPLGVRQRGIWPHLIRISLLTVACEP